MLRVFEEPRVLPEDPGQLLVPVELRLDVEVVVGEPLSRVHAAGVEREGERLVGVVLLQPVQVGLELRQRLSADMRNSELGACGILFFFSNDNNDIFLHFYQVNLTGDKLFK